MTSEEPKDDALEFDEEDLLTDITIGTDGRIYVFGASRVVLAVLQELGVAQSPISERLEP